MARPLRIQYPGAVYHVMARGSHGQPIFKDDKDRERFLETLGESCQKTGWLVHAYVLMGNHYHVLIETPEPNLVGGMKWLQGAYTQRYNGRHKVFGHLFQGRYKAVIVDGHESQYFQVVSTYIHLNPARAKLIRIGEQKLSAYRWSSYPGYLNGTHKRPAWLNCERVLGSLGLPPGAAKGYEAYVEARVLELGSKTGRDGLDEQWKDVRRGWYVGGEAFRKKLADDLEKAAKGRRRESHSGPARAAHDEAAAERYLEQGLRALGWNAERVADAALAAPEKLALACWLRQNTTVSLRWIAQRLQMGHYTRVTQAVSRTNRRPGPNLRRLGKKLKVLENDLQPNLL